jgi:hypothetical protein
MRRTMSIHLPAVAAFAVLQGRSVPLSFRRRHGLCLHAVEHHQCSSKWDRSHGQWVSHVRAMGLTCKICFTFNDKRVPHVRWKIGCLGLDSAARVVCKILVSKNESRFLNRKIGAARPYDTLTPLSHMPWQRAQSKCGGQKFCSDYLIWGTFILSIVVGHSSLRGKGKEGPPKIQLKRRNEDLTMNWSCDQLKRRNEDLTMNWSCDDAR